jgi:hypothetical protein
MNPKLAFSGPTIGAIFQGYYIRTAEIDDSVWTLVLQRPAQGSGDLHVSCENCVAPRVNEYASVTVQTSDLCPNHVYLAKRLKMSTEIDKALDCNPLSVQCRTSLAGECSAVATQFKAYLGAVEINTSMSGRPNQHYGPADPYSLRDQGMALAVYEQPIVTPELPIDPGADQDD